MVLKFNSRRGFTLIELILVIAILGVLSGIGIPKFSGFIQTSRLSADQATVENLNKATPLARMTSSTDDLFLDEDESSEDLLELLVSDGYFTDDIKPQSKGGKFKWILGDEKWSLVFEDSFYVITLSDGLCFSTTTDGRLEGSYEGDLKDIVIPGSINGTDITNIWQGAFKDKGLTSVKFAVDSKIQQIHARAFKDNLLTNIHFPDSMTEIHSSSFESNKLTTIKLPPNLTLIESHAFKNNELREVDFPDKLETIGGYAFENNALIEIELPNSVKSIGIGAFQGNSITKVTIGSNVTTIGASIFGTNTWDFVTKYGNVAGTYILIGENWVRQ